ncbi:MAG: hypothetical protein RRC34_11610 [Lentisphaeria bacterium]|nr:hypothetical protein [Lentisphaeria bacterium]
MRNLIKCGQAWVPFMLLVLLTGCATSRYLKRGDQALSRQAPVEARRYFELALARKPDLSADPVFMEKLRVSRRDARLAEGNTARAREDWLAAVTFYQQSLAYEPGYQPAVAAIESTRTVGRQVLYDGALQAADRQDGKTARTRLSEALRLVPDDTLSAQALASLDAPEKNVPPRPLADYRAAVAAAAAKRWHEAAETYAAVKGAAPWHLPARMGETGAREKIAEADLLANQAQEMFDRKAIPQTRQVLTRLEALYPTHPQYLSVLTAVESVEADVAALLREAENLINQNKYDQSVELCEQALFLYPAHPEARRVQETAEQKAADSYLTQAGVYLGQKKYSLAARSYHRVFDYPFRHDDAREGLALISKEIAMESNRDKKPASALLWATHAETYRTGTISADAMGKLQWQIMSRYPLNMSVSVAAIDRFSGEAARLEDRLAQDMTRMTDAPDGYLVAIDVLDVVAETTLIRVEELTQPFDVPVEVDNPDWYHLRDRVSQQHAYYERLEHLCHDRRRAAERYEKTADPQNPKHMDKLRHLRQQTRDAERDMRAQRDHLEDLRRRFRHTYPRMTVLERRFWNYRRETSRLTVALKTRMIIYDPAKRAEARPRVFESVQVAEDALIVNPNAQVGVDPDPLILPAVDDMRAAAVADCAEQMSEVFRPVILDDYFDSLNQQAAAAEDDEIKLACQLALWMMQRKYAPEAAARTYKSLMDSVVYPR